MSRNRYDWSKLCSDIVRSIFEGLSTKDYHRARTVCSNWYSVSTTCKRPLYPWRMILNNNSSLLYDPEEDKSYEIEHEGIDFSEINVIASYSNWVLNLDRSLNFYLLNVFTRERIDLPSVDSLFPGDKWDDYTKRKYIIFSKKPAVLWINERTRDYVVAWSWSYKEHYLFSYKKGDASWCNLEGIDCVDLTYKDNKLYVLTKDHCIKIIDLPRDSLVQEVGRNFYGNGFDNYHICFGLQAEEHIWETSVAITNSGDILIVSLKWLDEKPFLNVYKMSLESSEWERVDSLGDEMLIFGHGVTVRAPVKEIDGCGIKTDSVGFNNYDLWPPSKCFMYGVDYSKFIFNGVFDLVTSTITPPKGPEPLGFSASKRMWFVPGND